MFFGNILITKRAKSLIKTKICMPVYRLVHANKIKLMAIIYCNKTAGKAVKSAVLST